MFDRQTQIDLMKDVEERTIGYLRKWMQDREFNNALHRYDEDGDGRDGGLARVAGGGR